MGLTSRAQVTPAGPWNVRTRVHEYGGGAFLVAPAGDTVYFSNFADQRLYAQAVGGAPVPLTADTGADLRFADYVLDAPRGRLIAVCPPPTPTPIPPPPTHTHPTPPFPCAPMLSHDPTAH